MAQHDFGPDSPEPRTCRNAGCRLQRVSSQVVLPLFDRTGKLTRDLSVGPVVREFLDAADGRAVPGGGETDCPWAPPAEGEAAPSPPTP